MCGVIMLTACVECIKCVNVFRVLVLSYAWIILYLALYVTC